MMDNLMAEPSLSEITLSYKSKVKISECPKVSNSKDAFNALWQNWDKAKIEFVEEFKILILNRAHRAVGVYELSSGGTSATIADPKLVFGAAIKTNASSIVLAHNHPSGNLTPSDADIKLTKKLVSLGEMLEIRVVDHIIITSEGFYSFADEGLL